jgi:hypothetical protein
MLTARVRRPKGGLNTLNPVVLPDRLGLGWDRLPDRQILDMPSPRKNSSDLHRSQ